MRRTLTPPSEWPLEIGLLWASLEDARQKWWPELQGIEEGALTWQPFENGHSIGAILLHIAEVELFWIENVIAGLEPRTDDADVLLSDQINQYDVRWPTPPLRPLGHYGAILESIRKRSRNALRLAGDPKREIAMGERTVTPEWVISHLIQHESYHGGQAVLLRLLYERC